MQPILIIFAIALAPYAAHGSELQGAEQDLTQLTAEITSRGEDEWAAVPHVAQARAAFSEAKRRFLAGLPAGSQLRVTAGTSSDGGIIVVDRIENGSITGHWWEGMPRAYSPQRKDIYTLSEKDILDWAIVLPNGVTEGNWGSLRLGPAFVVARWYTGRTCDQAKGEASSTTMSEAKRKCGALGAWACRVEDQAFFLGTCDWDEAGKLYRIQGVSSFGCCG
jgi:hypothetical protein